MAPQSEGLRRFLVGFGGWVYHCGATPPRVDLRAIALDPNGRFQHNYDRNLNAKTRHEGGLLAFGCGSRIYRRSLSLSPLSPSFAAAKLSGRTSVLIHLLKRTIKNSPPHEVVGSF